jgi:hypothetical protein
VEVVLILLIGSSTYLKKFQLINSISTEIIFANRVYRIDLTVRLIYPSSSSV